MDKVYVVTDFGPGDGGKGGIVHALSCMQDDEVNLIIKRGGAQGSHGVRTSYQESFNFSQWGCGTLEGIPTFCSEQMIISPVGLDNESTALRRLGIDDPFLLLSIDPNCICATPYHMISSQLEELLLGKNPRGTIGTGVGRACRMFHESGDTLTLRAIELTDKTLIRKKLQRQCEYYRAKYDEAVKTSILPEDMAIAEDNLAFGVSNTSGVRLSRSRSHFCLFSEMYSGSSCALWPTCAVRSSNSHTSYSASRPRSFIIRQVFAKLRSKTSFS